MIEAKSECRRNWKWSGMTLRKSSKLSNSKKWKIVFDTYSCQIRWIIHPRCKIYPSPQINSPKKSKIDLQFCFWTLHSYIQNLMLFWFQFLNIEVHWDVLFLPTQISRCCLERFQIKITSPFQQQIRYWIFQSEEDHILSMSTTIMFAN